MRIQKPKSVKLVIGKEYEVQGRFAKLEAIEGNDAVCRDRWDNQFTCDIGCVREKRKVKSTGVR